MANEAKQWDKKAVLELLEKSDKAVERALMVLYSRQTADEQSSHETKWYNNRGFRSVDAHTFTYFAKYVQRRAAFGIPEGKRLTFRMLNDLRHRNHKGQMRIGHYTRQLLEEIQRKAATCQDPTN